eukprot:COSAG04_NODE_743_length_10649_cov_26.557820_13_plen_133_part_00
MIEGVDEGAAGGLLEEARREVARQRAAELDRHLGAGSPGMAAEASAQPPAIQRLIGVFMFATIVFELARPYLRFLLDLLRSAGPRPPKTQRLDFTDAARSDIATWQQVLTACRLNKRPVCTNVRASTFRCEL